ncbi:unnamed protein product [Rotaria magnacalcarata]
MAGGRTGQKSKSYSVRVCLVVLIAVATIIVTIQQNELNKANRANDLEIAQKQREQDLYISNQTREPGRELNARQRQQEQFLADQQRQESLVDNYTREVTNLEMKDASFQEDHQVLTDFTREFDIIWFFKLEVYNKLLE